MKTIVQECPKCKHETKFYENPEWLMSYLTPLEGRMMSALLEARRQQIGVTPDQMTRAAYLQFENDLTKIPTNARDTIRTKVSLVNRKIQKRGWRIVGHNTTRNGYWLVPILKQGN